MYIFPILTPNLGGLLCSVVDEVATASQHSKHEQIDGQTHEQQPTLTPARARRLLPLVLLI